MKVLVFDTETTGLPKEKNSSIYKTNEWPHILQLSYILYDTDKNQVLSLEDDIIKIDENIEIPLQSTAIHGITKEDTKNGINIKDALAKFQDCANISDLLVGHNVSFDKRMVLVEAIRNNIRLNLNETYCTMKNSVEICKIQAVNEKGETYLKYPKLEQLFWILFNRHIKNAHNAITDVLICLICFCKYELKKNILSDNRTIRAMYLANQR